LAAPTGKAANRMWTSIRRGLEAVLERDPVDEELLSAGVEPQTMHRLLGYIPGTDRFRHHDNNPLAATTVIVDEASMIDLVLMERLLRALAPGARLVVLGDADQLPSVDAGAVLRDLVQAGAGRGFAVQLTRSFRMDPQNPAGRAILTAAREVNAGRAAALLDPAGESPGRLMRRDALSALEYQGVEFWATGGEISRVHEFVDHWLKKRIRGQRDFERLSAKVYRYLDERWADEDERDLAALFAIYDTSRLLTVTRRLSTGSEALNRRLHKRVLADASLSYSPDFVPGEPVMMRRNDYERGLFNGDQGMVVRVSDSGGPQQFRVVFPRGGSFAMFRLDALRTHIELSFAMTVHKSQGSEFDEIALILPAVELPLLTREMLYTGMTRARRSVVLIGTEDLARAAIVQQGQRFSGLADKLTAASAAPAGETRGEDSPSVAHGAQ
jgi:exodeoxyribonuclease V alpha subunit